jgi:hypothetical protein
MQIPKEQILEMLQQQGKDHHVGQAKKSCLTRSIPTSTQTCCRNSVSTLKSYWASSAAASPASSGSVLIPQAGPQPPLIGRMTAGCE